MPGASWVIRRDENGLLTWAPKTWADEVVEWPAFEVRGPAVADGSIGHKWPCRESELYCPHKPACKNY